MSLKSIVLKRKTRVTHNFCTEIHFSRRARENGHAVAQLLGALRCKPEGRSFDFRWCHWNFSLPQSFRSHCDPGIDSASNRNEYQEYFLGVKAAGA